MAPGHEITITDGTAHIEVTVGGHVVAVSDRPVLLAETGLPVRYYLRRDDVRMDLLRPSATRTTCPFKGEASYWSAEVGGETRPDVAWSYETPLPQAAAIAGLLCFYPERVQFSVG